MKKTDLAYIAGIIDGDGCIFTNLHRSTKHYEVGISIQMIDEAPIHFIYSLFGGNISSYIETDNGRTVYRLQFKNYKAEPLLQAIKPYLLIKKSRAEIAIRMLNLHPKRRHYTPMERFLQEIDAKEIRRLNQHCHKVEMAP